MKKLIIDSQATAWAATAKKLATLIPKHLYLEISPGPGMPPNHCLWETSDGSWGHILENGKVTQFCPARNGHIDITKL